MRCAVGAKQSRFTSNRSNVERSLCSPLNSSFCCAAVGHNIFPARVWGNQNNAQHTFFACVGGKVYTSRTSASPTDQPLPLARDLTLAEKRKTL